MHQFSGAFKEADMKKITFAIQKGGTGKTSIAVSTATELAKIGKTLVIDADPQGNASTWLGVENMTYELSDILTNDNYTIDDIHKTVRETQVENLFIIPTAGLGGGLGNYQKYGANDDPKAITRLLRMIQDEYEFCIIDTSPSFGGIETSCFLASHETVTVLKIDEFSTDGLQIFFDNLQKMKRRHDTDLPELSKIVLNVRDMRLVQQNRIVSQLEALAEKTGRSLYIVPVDQTFPKAQSVHVPIQMLEGTKKETLEVIKLLAEDLSHGVGVDE